jgi:CubicO group peptidase (beta-lactamase class C family)
MNRLDPGLDAHLDEAMARAVASGAVGGVSWLAARGDDVVAGAAGVLTRDQAEPVVRDSIFRISSMTKPIVAAAAMTLVDDGTLALDEPVTRILPELRDRQVLLDPNGPLDGATRPAERDISLRDLLTLRPGIGMDMSRGFPQPILEGMGRLELGDGPPNPQGPPPRDEWIARLATLPLQHQPGTRWLYHVGIEILGVLVSRAVCAPLGIVLRERIFEPLGMADTGFWTPQVDRLTTCYAMDPSTGERATFDPPRGQWSSPPAFPSGGAGLVSTVDDMHRFGGMLLAGGTTPGGARVLADSTVAAMTSDQLGIAAGAAGITPQGDDSMGWGFGLGIQLRTTERPLSPGSYGWEGGLGSSWWNDPVTQTVGVVLTTDAFAGPDQPVDAIGDFWQILDSAGTT